MKSPKELAKDWRHQHRALTGSEDYWAEQGFLAGWTARAEAGLAHFDAPKREYKDESYAMVDSSPPTVNHAQDTCPCGNICPQCAFVLEPLPLADVIVNPGSQARCQDAADGTQAVDAGQDVCTEFYDSIYRAALTLDRTIAEFPNDPKYWAESVQVLHDALHAQDVCATCVEAKERSKTSAVPVFCAKHETPPSLKQAQNVRAVKPVRLPRKDPVVSFPYEGDCAFNCTVEGLHPACSTHNQQVRVCPGCDGRGEIFNFCYGDSPPEVKPCPACSCKESNK